MSSFRAATQNPWSHQHVGVLFFGGVLLFWLVALCSYRAAPDDEHLTGDVAAPQGILLR